MTENIFEVGKFEDGRVGWREVFALNFDQCKSFEVQRL